MLDNTIPHVFLEGILRPADYAVLAREAKRHGSTIIHATCLQVVSTRLFDALERDWSEVPGVVPRLALVFRFSAWAFFRNTTGGLAARLRAHGTELGMFYDEQFEDGHVHDWLETGIVRHPVDRVLEGLWPLDPMIAGLVIRAAFDLIPRDSTRSIERMTTLARIARRNGCFDLASAIDAHTSETPLNDVLRRRPE